jgi:uncharacterized protein
VQALSAGFRDQGGQVVDRRDVGGLIKVGSGAAPSTDSGNVTSDMSSVPAQIDLKTLRARRQPILRYASDHGARNVRVFGSAARGDAAANDVDLLVEMEPGRSLLDLVGLWQDLEDFLGVGVDVLTDGGVSPYLRERIYAEAVPL